MGEVWLVFNTTLRRLEVIKLIEAKAAEEKSARDRFLREGFLMAQVQHSNVVSLYDAGQTPNGALYLSMEHIRGQTLSQILRRAKLSGRLLPPSLVASVARSACQALSALYHTMHEGQPLRLIHRDISPQNIMVDYDGHVKILDFGVAYAPVVSGLTRTGAIVGKPCYMSPEQIMKRTLDDRSDLFSLGVVLYGLLTGERLFSNKPAEVMTQMLSHHGLESVDRAKMIPNDFRPILRRLLAVEPAERYGSAEEADRALAEISPVSPDMAAPELARFMELLFSEESKESLLEIQSILKTMESVPSRAPSDAKTAVLVDHLTTLRSTVIAGPGRRSTRRGRTFVMGLGVVGLSFVLGMMTMWFYSEVRRPEAGAPASVVRSGGPQATPIELAPTAQALPETTSLEDATKKLSTSRASNPKRKKASHTATPSKRRKPSLAQQVRQHLRQDRLDEAGALILKMAKDRPDEPEITKCVRAALFVGDGGHMKICLSEVDTTR